MRSAVVPFWSLIIACSFVSEDKLKAIPGESLPYIVQYRRFAPHEKNLPPGRVGRIFARIWLTAEDRSRLRRSRSH